MNFNESGEWSIIRSRQRKCSVKKGVLRKFAIVSIVLPERKKLLRVAQQNERNERTNNTMKEMLLSKEDEMLYF